ncbi:tRNA glutamyl-Q(34) synthetase GluQRS [Solimonas terrae]|uniref:Glutamyl-Q tRNA(Asp) synthetase n=1 Tax=Solimonas terrae TaxID=1396819 RepID=A0A6M2BUU1_9GAMM|nr:tRNA glutamyl-Q(34) synthetase GluQRS [Solimonas terrae]NGY06154.1 tRNA glutamyl-Q(34) synthetase GluQRS [Solimonas terrae]
MTVRSPARHAYRGRFAPTPSGPLHLGSLMTALASWLEARTHDGRWLLRIDDLDGPRCVAGVDARILQQLEAHGLYWDEAPRYQSAHLDEYRAAVSQLQQTGRLYACRCTRAELAAGSRIGPDGAVYAGTCREARLGETDAALRLTVGARQLRYQDGVQGELSRALDSELGDFVVRRRDGIVGYHLACAIDEHAQQISDVVRGADLIGSTFAQMCVQRELMLQAPRYHHLPVIGGRDGLKLSKQNHANPITAEDAGRNLWLCLQWLQQQPPAALLGAPPSLLLEWARRHWRLASVPAQTWVMRQFEISRFL